MKKVTNNLIIFNDWLDEYPNYKFGIMVVWMVVGGLLLNFSYLPTFHSMAGLLTGMALYCIAGIMALFRVRMSSGRTQFDYDVYGSPNVGDVVKILKSFYCSQYALPNPNFDTWWHILGRKKIRVFTDVDRITGLLKLFPQSPGVIEFIREGSEHSLKEMMEISNIYTGKDSETKPGEFNDEVKEYIKTRDWYKDNLTLDKCVDEMKEYTDISKKQLALTKDIIPLYEASVKKGNSGHKKELKESKKTVEKLSSEIEIRESIVRAFNSVKKRNTTKVQDFI